jgi:hypothetical protein
MSLNGRWVVSAGNNEQSLRIWELDWELEAHEPADWDEGARPHLVNFLARQTPFAGEFPEGPAPQGWLPKIGGGRAKKLYEDQVREALTRRGTPTWSAKDFQQLLVTLGWSGYGWLRPQGVHRELEKMARTWQGPPPL